MQQGAILFFEKKCLVLESSKVDVLNSYPVQLAHHDGLSATFEEGISSASLLRRSIETSFHCFFHISPPIFYYKQSFSLFVSNLNL
jgi:hypothetical protein